MRGIRPRVAIAVPSLQPHDAVGNDVLRMAEWLTGRGVETAIFAEGIAPSLRGIAQPLQPRDRRWASAGDILIYNHSTGWGTGRRLLERTRNRVVVRYHNVTPPRFFEGYAENYRKACEQGEAETRELAGRPDTWFLGDSEFNAGELEAAGVGRERCGVVAPFHAVERIARAPLSQAAIGMLRGTGPVGLFVGAFRPNKGHAKAVRVWAEFCRLTGERGPLVFAGNLDPALNRYKEAIEALARDLGIADLVECAHGVSLSELRAYYFASTFFLCMSEHEGFCVPLVEAMCMRSPIVAHATTAVGETCGDAAISFAEFDARAFAEEMARCYHDPAARAEMMQRGRLRYEREFTNEVSGARLERFLARVAEHER
jgi:glycosyltransferase involved in cell wall biosynthesis